MDRMLLLFLTLVMVTYQAWVSLLVFRSSAYDRRQKTLQFLGIWLLPLLGSVVAHLVLRTDGVPRYKPEPGWTEPGDHAS